MGVGGSPHAPVALTAGMIDPTTIEWAPGPDWKGEKNLAVTGIGFLDRPVHNESL